MKIITALLIALALAACGGGDPEDFEQQDTLPVNCQANPKVCE